MKPTTIMSVLVFVVASVATLHAAEVQLNGYTFRIPDGYTVELVAKPPLVTYPICADFDEQGRLYVAEASGAQSGCVTACTSAGITLGVAACMTGCDVAKIYQLPAF